MVATLVEKVDDLQAIQREFLAKQGEAMSTIINHKSTAINSEHIVAAAATAAREAVQSAVGEFLATHRPDVSIVPLLLSNPTKQAEPKRAAQHPTNRRPGGSHEATP